MNETVKQFITFIVLHDVGIALFGSLSITQLF